MTVKWKPDGYHHLTPYFIVDGGRRAIAWYEKVFGAKLRMCMDAGEGKVGHAELLFGDSVLMLADENLAAGARSPERFGGTPALVLLYVDDVDRVFALALANGATQLQPVSDKFYGDRSGTLKDPFGHHWGLATHKENVSLAEMEQRAAAHKPQP